MFLQHSNWMTADISVQIKTELATYVSKKEIIWFTLDYLTQLSVHLSAIKES